MKLAIVKYNAGNIQSLIYSLDRLGIHSELTDDKEKLTQADKVIFPGVGEASSSMRYLHEAGLATFLPTLKQPFLGICIGQQLMCAHSEEGDVDCLGIFPVKVKKFEAQEGFKVPHMGWNTLTASASPLLNGISPEDYVYYVHSYYCEISEFTIGKTDYTKEFSAALHRDNFYSAQFHPEKSGKVGERLLKNFLEL